MANSNNKQSSGFFSNAVGVAKKLSSTDTSLLNHVAPDSVAKLTQVSSKQSVIDGQYQTANVFASKIYDNPQQVLREHLPNVSRQFLGRHYSKVNNVANFVSPQFSDKLSDYLFEQLNQISNNLSSVDAVLDEAGVRDLEELTQDVDRSRRLSQALIEQNKWLASLQGAVTGATGVLGSTLDIPASLLMSLRIIYQVGRSYGFDLSKESDQEIVQHIFRQIDLGVIAEKQTLLLALKTLSSTIQTHDLSQLQQMLGSTNDIDALKKYFVDENGEYKLGWLNQLSKVSLLDKLTRLTPLAGAGISAVYSLRLVDEVNHKAQQVFSHAREYLIQHKDVQLSPLLAYEKSMELLAQAAPKLMESVKSIEHNLIEPVLNKAIEIEGNENITQVKVLKKTQENVDGTTALDTQDEQVADGLAALAKKEVTPSDNVPPQQAALANDEDILWQENAQADENTNLVDTSLPSKAIQSKK